MAQHRRVRLAEIAARARVSVTTVSNVVNGRLHLMSEDTRKRVQAEIDALNYRPHEGARSMRLSRNQTIGLIIVDDEPRFLADPMITNTIAGMSNWLGPNGFGLLISGVSNAVAEDVPMLRRNQTDALCVMPSGTTAERRALYRRLSKAGQPVLVFQDIAPDFLTDATSVYQDDRGAGRMLARRLIDRGARRLAFLTLSQHWPAMNARQRGVAEETEVAGAVLKLLHCGSESVEDTQQAIMRHVERQGLPDAFIGGNDQMAIAALNWALDRNLSVPSDIRVAGFNGFEFASYVRPKLTTVTSPAYEMGRKGAMHLLKRLDTGRFEDRTCVFETALRIGQSD